MLVPADWLYFDAIRPRPLRIRHSSPTALATPGSCSACSPSRGTGSRNTPRSTCWLAVDISRSAIRSSLRASPAVAHRSCGKSAQFPLCVWLPDAAEGPDAGTGLIHAAIDGDRRVYMVARSNALFACWLPNAMKTVAIIGALTAIFAATIGQFGAERHQARAGLFDDFATGIHVPGAG